MVSVGTIKSKIERKKGSEYFYRLEGLRKIRLKYKHWINHTIFRSILKDTNLNISFLQNHSKFVIFVNCPLEQYEVEIFIFICVACLESKYSEVTV